MGRGCTSQVTHSTHAPALHLASLSTSGCLSVPPLCRSSRGALTRRPSSGGSRDTLSPGKDAQTWLSFSIIQPVLLELRVQTAHLPPPPSPHLICMDFHRTKTPPSTAPRLKPLRAKLTRPHRAHRRRAPVGELSRRDVTGE